MQPTEIKIFPVKKQSKVKAFVQVTFDQLLVVKNIRVMDTGNGLWVGFPSEKGKDDKYYDQVFILNSREDGTPGQEFYKKLTGTILRKYQETVGESGNGGGKKQTSTQQSGDVFGDGVPF